MRGQILFFSLLLALCLSSSALAQEPRFEIDASEYHFGKVFEGDKVHHTFRFRNAGSGPLIINRIRSSCGCTVPRLSAEILAPGETAELEMVFNTARFRGQQVKTVYLYTNDPRREVIQLSLRGTVEQIIVPEPARIDFGTVKSGEDTQMQVVLHSRVQQPVVLGPLRITHEDLRATLSDDILEPGGSVTLSVNVLPNQERGRLSGYVILATDHPGLPEMRIAIFGMVTQAP